MKIGFALDDSLDSTDGVQQYVLLLGKWLSNKGHEVHYLVGESYRSDLPNIHSLSKNLKVRFNKNRLTVPLPTSKSNLTKLLNKEKFDILRVQMPFSPFLVGKIIKYAPKSTKIIGTFHIAPYSRRLTIGTKMLAKTTSRNLKKFDKFISVSEVAQSFALETYNISSSVIPNAVDLTKYKSINQKTKKYDIIFVGRLVKRKGCINLLKALALIKKQTKLPHLKIAIVGDGPENTKLKKYVEANGLADWCQFFGYVKESKKIGLLQSSKIAVFPAIGGESFGIVLIEAMASGLLVLAGNNPGYNSVMSANSKTLFPAENYKQLASLISKALNDQKFYKHEFNMQQDIVKNFDVENVGSDIMRVYSSLVKGN